MNLDQVRTDPARLKIILDGIAALPLHAKLSTLAFISVHCAGLPTFKELQEIEERAIRISVGQRLCKKLEAERDWFLVLLSKYK